MVKESGNVTAALGGGRHGSAGGGPGLLGPTSSSTGAPGHHYPQQAHHHHHHHNQQHSHHHSSHHHSQQYYSHGQRHGLTHHTVLNRGGNGVSVPSQSIPGGSLHDASKLTPPKPVVVPCGSGQPSEGTGGLKQQPTAPRYAWGGNTSGGNFNGSGGSFARRSAVNTSGAPSGATTVDAHGIGQQINFSSPLASREGGVYSSSVMNSATGGSDHSCLPKESSHCPSRQHAPAASPPRSAFSIGGEVRSGEQPRGHDALDCLKNENTGSPAYLQFYFSDTTRVRCSVSAKHNTSPAVCEQGTEVSQSGSSAAAAAATASDEDDDASQPFPTLNAVRVQDALQRKRQRERLEALRLEQIQRNHKPGGGCNDAAQGGSSKKNKDSLPPNKTCSGVIIQSVEGSKDSHQDNVACSQNPLPSNTCGQNREPITGQTSSGPTTEPLCSFGPTSSSSSSASSSMNGEIRRSDVGQWAQNVDSGKGSAALRDGPVKDILQTRATPSAENGNSDEGSFSFPAVPLDATSLAAALLSHIPSGPTVTMRSHAQTKKQPHSRSSTNAWSLPDARTEKGSTGSGGGLSGNDCEPDDSGSFPQLDEAVMRLEEAAASGRRSQHQRKLVSHGPQEHTGTASCLSSAGRCQPTQQAEGRTHIFSSSTQSQGHSSLRGTGHHTNAPPFKKKSLSSSSEALPPPDPRLVSQFVDFRPFDLSALQPLPFRGPLSESRTERPSTKPSAAASTMLTLGSPPDGRENVKKELGVIDRDNTSPRPCLPSNERPQLISTPPLSSKNHPNLQPPSFKDKEAQKADPTQQHKTVATARHAILPSLTEDGDCTRESPHISPVNSRKHLSVLDAGKDVLRQQFEQRKRDEQLRFEEQEAGSKRKLEELNARIARRLDGAGDQEITSTARNPVKKDVSTEISTAVVKRNKALCREREDFENKAIRDTQLQDHTHRQEKQPERLNAFPYGNLTDASSSPVSNAAQSLLRLWKGSNATCYEACGRMFDSDLGTSHCYTDAVQNGMGTNDIQDDATLKLNTITVGEEHRVKQRSRSQKLSMELSQQKDKGNDFTQHQLRSCSSGWKTPKAQSLQMTELDKRHDHCCRNGGRADTDEASGISGMPSHSRHPFCLTPHPNQTTDGMERETLDSQSKNTLAVLSSSSLSPSQAPSDNPAMTVFPSHDVIKEPTTISASAPLPLTHSGSFAKTTGAALTGACSGFCSAAPRVLSDICEERLISSEQPPPVETHNGSSRHGPLHAASVTTTASSSASGSSVVYYTCASCGMHPPSMAFKSGYGFVPPQMMVMMMMEGCSNSSNTTNTNCTSSVVAHHHASNLHTTWNVPAGPGHHTGRRCSIDSATESAVESVSFPAASEKSYYDGHIQATPSVTATSARNVSGYACSAATKCLSASLSKKSKDQHLDNKTACKNFETIISPSARSAASLCSGNTGTGHTTVTRCDGSGGESNACPPFSSSEIVATSVPLLDEEQYFAQRQQQHFHQFHPSGAPSSAVIRCCCCCFSSKEGSGYVGTTGSSNGGCTTTLSATGLTEQVLESTHPTVASTYITTAGHSQFGKGDKKPGDKDNDTQQDKEALASDYTHRLGSKKSPSLFPDTMLPAPPPKSKTKRGGSEGEAGRHAIQPSFVNVEPIQQVQVHTALDGYSASTKGEVLTARSPRPSHAQSRSRRHQTKSNTAVARPRFNKTFCVTSEPVKESESILEGNKQHTSPLENPEKISVTQQHLISHSKFNCVSSSSSPRSSSLSSPQTSVPKPPGASTAQPDHHHLELSCASAASSSAAVPRAVVSADESQQSQFLLSCKRHGVIASNTDDYSRMVSSSICGTPICCYTSSASCQPVPQDSAKLTSFASTVQDNPLTRQHTHGHEKSRKVYIQEETENEVDFHPDLCSGRSSSSGKSYQRNGGRGVTADAVGSRTAISEALPSSAQPLSLPQIAEKETCPSLSCASFSSPCDGAHCCVLLHEDVFPEVEGCCARERALSTAEPIMTGSFIRRQKFKNAHHFPTYGQLQTSSQLLENQSRPPAHYLSGENNDVYNSYKNSDIAHYHSHSGDRGVAVSSREENKRLCSCSPHGEWVNGSTSPHLGHAVPESHERPHQDVRLQHQQSRIPTQQQASKHPPSSFTRTGPSLTMEVSSCSSFGSSATSSTSESVAAMSGPGGSAECFRQRPGPRSFGTACTSRGQKGYYGGHGGGGSVDAPQTSMNHQSLLLEPTCKEPQLLPPSTSSAVFEASVRPSPHPLASSEAHLQSRTIGYTNSTARIAATSTSGITPPCERTTTTRATTQPAEGTGRHLIENSGSPPAPAIVVPPLGTLHSRPVSHHHPPPTSLRFNNSHQPTSAVSVLTPNDGSTPTQLSSNLPSAHCHAPVYRSSGGTPSTSHHHIYHHPLRSLHHHREVFTPGVTTNTGCPTVYSHFHATQAPGNPTLPHHTQVSAPFSYAYCDSSTPVVDVQGCEPAQQQHCIATGISNILSVNKTAKKGDPQSASSVRATFHSCNSTTQALTHRPSTAATVGTSPHNAMFSESQGKDSRTVRTAQNYATGRTAFTGVSGKQSMDCKLDGGGGRFFKSYKNVNQHSFHHNNEEFHSEDKTSTALASEPSPLSRNDLRTQKSPPIRSKKKGTNDDNNKATKDCGNTESSPRLVEYGVETQHLHRVSTEATRPAQGKCLSTAAITGEEEKKAGRKDKHHHGTPTKPGCSASPSFGSSRQNRDHSINGPLGRPLSNTHKTALSSSSSSTRFSLSVNVVSMSRGNSHALQRREGCGSGDDETENTSKLFTSLPTPGPEVYPTSECAKTEGDHGRDSCTSRVTGDSGSLPQSCDRRAAPTSRMLPSKKAHPRFQASDLWPLHRHPDGSPNEASSTEGIQSGPAQTTAPQPRYQNSRFPLQQQHAQAQRHQQFSGKHSRSATIPDLSSRKQWSFPGTTTEPSSGKVLTGTSWRRLETKPNPVTPRQQHHVEEPPVSLRRTKKDHNHSIRNRSGGYLPRVNSDIQRQTVVQNSKSLKQFFHSPSASSAHHSGHQQQLFSSNSVPSVADYNYQ